MNCEQCDKKLKKNDKFCKNCGFAVNEETKKYNYGGALTSLIKVTTPLVLLINYSGWIVSVIWLLFLGSWQLLILAFIVSYLFTFVFSIILVIVQMPIVWIMQKLLDSNHKNFALFSASISAILIDIFSLAWVVYVFSLSLTIAGSGPILPYILLGYGVAVGPFQYMGSKEDSDSIATFLGIWLVSVSYLALMIGYFLNIMIVTLIFIPILALMILRFTLKTTSLLLDEQNTQARQEIL